MQTKTRSMKQTEKDVESHGGLQGIRKKPSMYIGTPDSHGIWTCLREILDNGVDENLAGRNSTVLAIEGSDGYLWGIDHGGGIPVGNIKIDVHGKKVTVSALTAIVRDAHTGAKFGSKGAYDKSRGTHGVGIKATNALALDFQVWTHRDNAWWTTQFKQGVEVMKVSKTTAPKLPHGLPKPKTGTIVKFKPDPSVFTKNAKFNPKHLQEWATITSYLNPGCKIEFVNSKGKSVGWESKKGASEYLDRKIKEYGCGVLGKHFVIRHKDLDVALSFTDYDGIDLAAYTNGLGNAAGGVHVDAVFKALSDAIKPYRKKRHTFTPTDLRDGVVGIVNFKISSPQFNNQVKEKLIDTRVSKPCYDLALEELQAFFASNKAMANRLCDRAQDLKGLKNEFAANKKVSRELSKVAKSNRALLPGKFLSSPRAKPNERELFIVEGESAKGSCEKARDASFQEVLPLKGKPLNVIKNKPERALESEEVMNILMCIGYDPSRPNPYDHLRVGKVILLADADDDGFHINLLVLAVFQRFLPKMFERGMIYVAKGPEYIICTPKANYTASSLEDLKKKIPNQSLLKQVIHLKGWGEVSHEALEQIAFNAKTRKMWKIMPISDKKKVRDYTALVGEDPLFRKQLLGVA